MLSDELLRSSEDAVQFQQTGQKASEIYRTTLESNESIKQQVCVGVSVRERE